MSIKDRKAGYEAALMNAGEWLKGKVVGTIARGNIIMRGDVTLQNGQYLFVATKEEIAKLTKGRMPK